MCLNVLLTFTLLTFTTLYLADLEWKIIYVSSAESEDHDQVLDSVLVGPVPPGKHMFVFQVTAYWSVIGCRSTLELGEELWLRCLAAMGGMI